MYKNKSISKMLKQKYLKSFEITDLVIKYQKARLPHKKQEYKDLIFSNVSRLIAKSAGYHTSARIEDEDLFQAGVVGFCEALEKFKPKMGNMFTTYLKFWVDKSIYSVLYGNNLIHTPRNVISYTNKQQRLEIAGKQVKYNKFSQAFINTTNMVNLDNDKEHDFKQLLRSPIEIDVDIEKKIMGKDVAHLMETYLDPREKAVLQLRYFSEDMKTLQDVSKELNLSKERIRQIEVIAIRKLRKHI